MARINQRQSLTAMLGLDSSGGPETPEETVARLERESQTLAMRLNSQGVDATKPEPEDSGLTKLLKTLGIPGAVVRSTLGEITDNEPGFNAGRAFSKERLWNNPVSGIQLLDQLGLAPTQTDSFGNKAARFGLGLGVDIVTDPISYLLGGITRPLQIGAPFASDGLKLTEQGLVQPLLRGAQAGLRGTGELGAAVGDAGVLAARKAATEAGTGALGSTHDAMEQAKKAISIAAGQVAPRPLTKMERMGLDLGTSLKKNETTRGIIGAVSKNAFADPAYVALRNKLARSKDAENRKVADKLDEILRSGKFTEEDAQLVADLADDPGKKAMYAAPAVGEGPPVPLRHVTPLTYPAPKSVQQATASELATNKVPTLLESLGLAEAPAFPSGRTPGDMLPETRARAVGNAPAVSAERLSPDGKFRIQVGVQNKALPSGVVNTPEMLKRATPEQLLQELAYQIDNGGPVSGTVNTVLEMVRRGVWEDLSKSLPIGAQRMYRKVAEHNAFRMLPSIGDSDASTRAFLSQRAPDFIRSIPDEDTRILFQTRINNALRDAEPLTPTGMITNQGVRQTEGLPALPSGRKPGNTLPEIPGVPQGHPGNLPPESLKPNGRFNVDTVDKTRVARTGLDTTVSALQKHTDEQLLQELSARVASGSKAGVTHVMLEMTRRGIWEKGSAMLSVPLQRAYNDILRRGTNGLLPAIGDSDDTVRALLSQRGDDLLNRMKDVDARDVAKAKIADTLQNAVPLQEGAVRSPAEVRPTGAPHADAIAENNRRAAEVSEAMRNPNITPTHPRDVRRPGAEGVHQLLEETPLQVLPDHVYQAFRFVTDTLKDYGDEKLKRGLLSSILANYFPRKLLPEEGASIGLSGMTTSQASAKTRTLRDTMANLANDPLAPKFERNFVRPFAKEVVESIRGIKTYDFFDDVVKQYGIKQDDMLARFGHQPGMNFTKPVGDYTLVDFAEFMNKSRQSEAYSKLGKVYLPNEIAQDLKQIHSAYDTDEGINMFLKMWDGATNIWKPMVTSLKPSFHIGNFIGNMWLSFLGGMTNPNRLLDGIDLMLGRAHEWKAGATKLTSDELKSLGQKWGAFDATRFTNDLSTGNPLRFAQEGMPKPVGSAKAFYDKLISLGQRGGAAVEGTNRAALFVDQMLKKVSAVAGPVSPDMLDNFAREATDHVNTFLFDYANGLTKFENTFLRRLLPFYSFARFNIPLQVAEAINQPGKFLLYSKVQNNLAQIHPSPDEMPSWMREGLNIGTTDEGSPIIFNPKLPLQDISRLSPADSGKSLLDMLHPLIKTPISLAPKQGFDFYTSKPIERYEGQTVEVANGVRVPAKWAFTAKTFGGAVSRSGSVANAFSADATTPEKLKAIRTVFPGLYAYDVKQARVTNAYDEVKRLGDLIRKQQDETGSKVPTARQLGIAR